MTHGTLILFYSKPGTLLTSDILAEQRKQVEELENEMRSEMRKWVAIYRGIIISEKDVYTFVRLSIMKTNINYDNCIIIL